MRIHVSICGPRRGPQAPGASWRANLAYRELALRLHPLAGSLALQTGGRWPGAGFVPFVTCQPPLCRPSEPLASITNQWPSQWSGGPDGFTWQAMAQTITTARHRAGGSNYTPRPLCSNLLLPREPLPVLLRKRILERRRGRATSSNLAVTTGARWAARRRPRRREMQARN